MHQHGDLLKDKLVLEERDRTTDSLGITASVDITAPEDRLKMRPDIMLVDLTTNDLSDMESRAPKKCKAKGEQEIIGREKITILERRQVQGQDPATQISLPDPGEGRA